MILRPNFRQGALAMAITAVFTTPAKANEPDTANQAGSKSAAESALPQEEMLVVGKYTLNKRIDTATGLGLTLHETPQSVSVMTSQRIVDQDLRSLTDVVNNAAGISAKGLDSSRFRFSARGFEINNYQIDGVPVTWESGGNAGETQTDTSLYERIEVVRGATGLLTGAGNPSASINLVRKHAESREFTGTVSAAVGRWNALRTTADVSAPITEDGAVRGRMVVNLEDSDSFRDYAGESKQVVYGVVDADLSDHTLLRVGASYQDNDPTASTWGGLPVWHSDGSRTDWSRSDTTAARWSSWASTVENYYLDLIHDFSNGWRAKFSINHNTNDADLDLVYLSGTVDKQTGEGLSASPRRSETERELTSYSLQLSGDYTLFGRQHELTLGVIDSEQDEVAYAYTRSDIAPVGNFYEWDGRYPQPTWGVNNKDVESNTQQFGAYAATRLSVSDQFKVIVGGRVADWERQGFSYGTPADYGDTGVFIPYAGALYDLTPQHKLYASYTEIFQPQNFQDRNGRFLDPVVGKSKEIGVKSRFFDEALHTTVTVFQIDQDDLAQADQGQTVPGSDNAQAYFAAQGTETEGYELEVVGQLAPGWDVSVSYTDFTAEDAKGNDVNTDQPRKLIKLYTSYQFGGALNALTVAGGVNWEGENYTATTNPVTKEPEKLTQDDFSLVNLMARYQITPQLFAQLNIDNALDETYYSQIGFYNQLEFGEPRNYTLSVNYAF